MKGETITAPTRADGRDASTLRPLQIERNFTCYAEGSVLVSMGSTRLLCTASIDENLPPFLSNKQQGWVTAEYGMLPRSTHTRNARDAVKGKQNGRAQEIQRLIGRSLRSSIDLTALGERQILIDCDVLQADGGTRCAAICGAWVALADACDWLVQNGKLTQSPLKAAVAAVSVGIVNGVPLLDLDYSEDSCCETDMNVVQLKPGGLVEIQGTAEGAPFKRDELDSMLNLAENGLEKIFQIQFAARQ